MNPYQATAAAPAAGGWPHAAPTGPGGSLHITIVGEGTYPYHAGGVSTWCHQLVQGMPEHSFTAVALSVDGMERSAWDAPPNLAQVVNIPLWGAPPPAPRRDRQSTTSFAELHYAFLRAMIRPQAALGDPRTIQVFLAALRGMFFYALANNLRAALISNDSLERLLEVWREAGMEPEAGELTLRHALAAADAIEHMLRPLSHPPIRSDVCHLSMNGISALVAMTAKWAFGTRIVMSEHGVYMREQYLSQVRESESYPVKVIMLRFFRALARAAYQVADLLTPHSQYNRRWQLRNNADPSRVRTMYNGINPEDFPVAQGEPEQPTIVFMGRIDPLKDLHTLIRSFAVVRTQVPNARLRMFGPVPPENGAYHESCVALIDQLGLTGAAVFEGRVPRQVDAYAAGHLVALTSVSEGFPYTVVESMSVGRPQVCTNVGGVSEAVGDAGFVVPPRDHDAIARACVQLLTDPELRQRLGRAARQRVLERFTLDQWNEAYREIYHELVTGRRAPRPAGRAVPAHPQVPSHSPAPASAPIPRRPAPWHPPAVHPVRRHPQLTPVARVKPATAAVEEARIPPPPPPTAVEGKLTAASWARWWDNRLDPTRYPVALGPPVPDRPVSTHPPTAHRVRPHPRLPPVARVTPPATAVEEARVAPADPPVAVDGELTADSWATWWRSRGLDLMSSPMNRR